MTYKALSPQLHTTADAAVKFFRSKYGVKKVCYEAAIDPRIPKYSPTFSGQMSDFHILCAEVCDGNYTDTLDGFVLDCMEHGLPVRLYIISPKGSPATLLNETIRQARKRGIGVIEIENGNAQVLVTPVPLALNALRRVDAQRFPTKYRQALLVAEETFRNGDPVKGCANVFDEIEALSRRLAERSKAKGLWTASPAGQRASRLNLSTGPWQKVVTELQARLDWVKIKPLCPKIDNTLLAQIVGITSHRNDSGHKVKSKSEAIKRNRELRTRFENAVDLFERLADAVRPLRI